MEGTDALHKYREIRENCRSDEEAMEAFGRYMQMQNSLGNILERIKEGEIYLGWPPRKRYGKSYKLIHANQYNFSIERPPSRRRMIMRANIPFSKCIAGAAEHPISSLELSN